MNKVLELQKLKVKKKEYSNRFRWASGLSIWCGDSKLHLSSKTSEDK